MNVSQSTHSIFISTSEGSGASGPLDSPARLVSSSEPLDGDRSAALAQVLLARQPAADGLLDADAGSTQLVCPQLLKISDLAGPEEDLGLTKLVFILVLRENMCRAQG